MTDVEKVIRGISACEPSKVKRNCSECPYKEEMNCDYVLWHDVIDLLKDQQKQIEQMNFIYGFVYGGKVKEIHELVRCKNCKHWEQSNGHCPFNSIFTNEDWFCADGEKR